MKYKCRICNVNDCNQNKSGSGGIEIGFSKWFASLEPYKTQILICYDCFYELAEKLNLSEWDIKLVIEQKATSPEVA